MAALARPDGDELLSVPPLPPNYQARPDMESVLRTALLNSSGGAVIGLTARSSGPAGIGKTTLAKAVCHDDQVRAKFSDGVFWLAFGRERTGDQLIKSLTAMLRLPVDSRPAAISEQLNGRRLLLVLDDVWTTEQVGAFAGLTAGTDGVLVQLFTTRKPELVASCAAAESVHVEPLSDDASLKLLRSLTGISSLRANKEESAALLAACHGNVAMLQSVAGLCRKRGVDGAAAHLESCRRRAAASHDRGAAVALPDDASTYGTLYAALDGALADFSPELARRAVMLAVLPEDTSVPWSVVGQLWGATAADVDASVGALSDANLVEIDRRRRTLTLIDLHLDYLRCTAKSELPAWHASLLRACARPAVGVEVGDRGTDQYWASGRRWMYHVREGGAPAIEAIAAALVELRLQAIALLPHDGEVLARLVRRCGPALTAIDVGFNSLDEPGALAIVRAAAAAQPQGGLTSLGLASCKLFSSGAKQIASLLEQPSCRLTSLDVQSNCIDSEGVSALAATASRLTSLNLCEVNRPSDKSDTTVGMLAVADALKGHTTRLTALDMSANKVDVAACRALGEALRVNTVLTSLDLSSNRLCGEWQEPGKMRTEGSYDAAGVRALAAAFQAPGSALRTCNLRSNGLRDADQQAVKSAAQGQLTLQV